VAGRTRGRKARAHSSPAIRPRRNNPRNAQGAFLAQPSAQSARLGERARHIQCTRSLGELSRSQQVARDPTAGRCERRPAFFAGQEFARVPQWGRERPHPRPRRLVQAAAPGVAHAPNAAAQLDVVVRGLVFVESRELTLTKTTTCPCRVRDHVRGHVGHHVRDHRAVLVAVNASALRADRAAFMTRLRALTAPAPSAFYRIYVMADLNG
jgi:hypothetical protein